MSKANGYCLKDVMTGTGKLLPFTYGADKDTCWVNSFDYLYATYNWMAPFWKQWDKSIKAARGHGFVMVPVHLSEVKNGK